METRTIARANELGVLGTTGIASLSADWKELTLTGTNTTSNIFNVTAADLAQVNSLNIIAPAEGSVFINITGPEVALTDLLVHLQGVIKEKVLFNLGAVSKLTITDSTILGTILAPNTNIVFANASVDGTLIAKNLSGTGIVKHTQFCGCVEAPTPTPTPTESTTPTPTESTTPTSTPTPTESTTPTSTPTPTESTTPTSTPTPTDTSAPTSTPTSSSTTVSSTSTPTPTATPSGSTPAPTPELTPNTTPSSTPTPTPVLTPNTTPVVVIDVDNPPLGGPGLNPDGGTATPAVDIIDEEVPLGGVLPKTGESGSAIFYLLGIGLVAGGLLLRKS
jgi:LPXTG-motif cell wall-anchored protein